MNLVTPDTGLLFWMVIIFGLMILAFGNDIARLIH